MLVGGVYVSHPLIHRYPSFMRASPPPRERDFANWSFRYGCLFSQTGKPEYKVKAEDLRRRYDAYEKEHYVPVSREEDPNFYL